MVLEQRVVVDGIGLSIRTWPCQEPAFRPVVLLPGTASTASDWDTVAGDLRRDRVVHAVDLRGHGASDWPGSYSIELMATDVMGLLPRLAPQLDVVGHSLGGLVACRAAIADRTPMVRLVLEHVGLLRARPPATPARPAGRLDFDWAVVEQVRPSIDSPDAAWPDVLRRIAVPTLAISGGPQSFVTPAQVTELCELIPDCVETSIDAGHLVHATQPRAFLRAVRSRLDA